MAHETPVLRVFVSSPGDVAEERALAERVLRRLDAELEGRVAVEGVIWEHEPLLATSTFQAQLRRPSECDVVVSILWARLGTRLPAGFTRADGSRYESGTEFEFEDAVEGFRRGGTPELLVYRKTTEPVVSLRDPAAALERLEQKRKLDGFVERWFHDRDDGTLRAAFHPFDDPARFEALLEVHLRKILARRFPVALQAGGGRGTWEGGSPFRGLDVFEAEHAPVFFGRTRETAEVVHALRARAAQGTAFVLLLGASGSGKSSLARAGVLPLLTGAGMVPGVRAWRTGALRPAEAPGDPLAALVTGVRRAVTGEAPPGGEVARLAAALHAAPGDAAATLLAGLADGEAVALVVDQLEELFTHEGESPDEEARFVDALAALARDGRAWIVGTLRSDFYAQCERLPALVALKEGEGQYHLLPPAPAQVAAMVVGPARLAGLRFEEDAATGDRLERVLVDAASAQPGGLPLLEFTLEELYRRRRDDGTLTFEAYRALGGVEGALATRAEAAWAALDEPVRATLPAVLRALVEVDPRAPERPARRAAPIAALAPAERALVDALVRARLLAAGSDEQGEPTATVAHEALLHHWPRVCEWARDDAEFLRTRARVEAAAALWREDGEAPERLLPAGKPLADALDLEARHGRELAAPLRRYVAASRAAHEGARRRRRRRVAALVGAVVAGTMLFAAFSLVQWRRAERARAQAAVQRTEALRASETLLTASLGLGFPDGALTEEQLGQLRDVLGRLEATGYRDTVELLVHPGRFRVVEAGGTPRPRVDGDDCARGGCREWPDAAEEARFVADVARRLETEVVRAVPAVPVRVRAMPSTEPWDPYPGAEAPAAEWNAAARRNHRLVVLLAGG